MNEPEPPDRGKRDLRDWSMEIETQAIELRTKNKGNEITTNTNQINRDSVSGINSNINKLGNNNIAINENAHSNLIEKGLQSLLKQKHKDITNAKNAVKGHPIILYTKNDMGPYTVYVQNKEGNIGKFHRISTAKLIRSAIPQLQDNIKSISAIGYNRIKVELINTESANKLVESRLLAEKKYEVYIPQFNIRRQGIIRNVDIEISEQELANIIKPKYGNNLEILQVRRLKRKVVKNNETSYVPTQTILVSFKGQSLPKQVIIEKIVFEVEPFIQRVVQCLKCLRYGHISSQCRGDERCKKCGGPHTNCSNEYSFCVLCNGDHEATNRELCPEFTKQKTIKNIMGNENISFREAVTKYKNSYANIVQTNTQNTDIINKQNNTVTQKKHTVLFTKYKTGKNGQC